MEKKKYKTVVKIFNRSNLNLHIQTPFSMLETKILRALPQVRRYLVKRSRSPFLFLPNETKHIFDEEKLTPEENKAAIPIKPNYDNFKKIHHEVINPEEVSDLVVKFNLNDILVSILSKDGYLFGDKNYLLTGTNKPTRFKATSILNSWCRIFNNQIKELKEISPMQFWDPVVSPQISKAIEEYGDNFEKLFQETRALKNSKLKKHGDIPPSELVDMITVDNLSLYVLNNLSSIESLAAFVAYMRDHIEYYTVEGLSEILAKLTDICYRLHGDIDYELYLSVKQKHPGVIQKLPSDTIDKLANLLASKNWELSKELIQVLIKRDVCPSETTMNEFLLNFVNSDPETKLKELSFLKLAIFSRGVNELSLQILLSTIRNIHEFSKLIELIKTSSQCQLILSKYQHILFATLKRVTTNLPLQKAQFVRVLTENNVHVDNDLMRVLEN